VTATTKITVVGSKVRAEIVLRSSKNLAANRRPTKVSLAAGGASFKLAKVKAKTSKPGKVLGTWRSALYSGDSAGKLVSVRGKSVKLTLISKSGRTSVTSKVASTPTTPTPGTGTGTTPGTQPANPFVGPSADLVGVDAFNHISKYLFNSRFTDCVAYWPNCSAVNESYVHCADFSWQYHKDTFSSQTDTHSYYPFTVTGANAFTNGSWAVAYTVSTGGSYVWSVAADGKVTGQYSYNGSVEQLGPFVWAQPGGTWNKPEGNCPA
jgi:hypothetical protein